MVARESRSGGCMAMILMRVRDGAGTRIFLSPLRRDTSEVDDTLKRIAAEMGPTDTLDDAIRLVVQNGESLNAEEYWRSTRAMWDMVLLECSGVAERRATGAYIHCNLAQFFVFRLPNRLRPPALAQITYFRVWSTGPIVPKYGATLSMTPISSTFDSNELSANNL
ncbi:hypothetical protein DFH06DRAFT_1319073 [Mycena polygramma]|nr:hypothetical protein DFH06DRAFT_1319073 [Mycena polygramma]